MRKKHRVDWTHFLPVAILCSSCLWTRVCVAGDAAGAVVALELKEAQVARKAAEARTQEAEEALALIQQQLEKLRVRYADLFLESQAQQKRFEQAEIRIGYLLLNREERDSDQLATQAFRILDQIQRQQHEAAQQVETFGTYLDSVLDVLQTSDTLRREVKARYDGVKTAVERTLKPLPQVAGRGSRDLEGRKYRVMAVNDDLQLVVMDQGYDAGIRAGSYWLVLRDGRTNAEIQVIDVRGQISAAMVLNGRLNDIGIGDIVVPKDKPGRQSD